MVYYIIIQKLKSKLKNGLKQRNLLQQSAQLFSEAVTGFSESILEELPKEKSI